MFTAENHPIVVVVENGRWDSWGPTGPRSEILCDILKETGGVNESVPPGWYLFNAELIEGESAYITFDPFISFT